MAIEQRTPASAATWTIRRWPGAAPRCAQDYQARISGPLFDRIDIHVDVPAVSLADLARAERASRLHVAEALSYRRLAPGQ